MEEKIRFNKIMKGIIISFFTLFVIMFAFLVIVLVFLLKLRKK